MTISLRSRIDSVVDTAALTSHSPLVGCRLMMKVNTTVDSSTAPVRGDTVQYNWLKHQGAHSVKESSGQIVITQTPASETVLPEETVTIQCKASSSMSDDMSLYQFKLGQNPKLLIHDANSRFTGVPDRFSGSYSGTDFTFTISGVQAEDGGDYYCGQDYSRPLTVIQFESSGQIVITQTPASVTVLPGETVTIQCKASSSMSNDMQLHLFKSGQIPKLLIYNGATRFTGVPDRFSGRYSGTDFTFTISGVQADDEGEYYCQQDYTTPLTVIQLNAKTSFVL
ncbi:unnamed protein product [Lepidochelys olivacea]